jgi:protein-export membrane protein, SecD/SecF family/protein-export membrane protein SecF
MEKKIIRFSKGFIPAAVFSTVVILFGIAGIFTRGINFGIDFQPGLINEVRISSPAAELTYAGNAKATLSLEKDKLEIVVSGTGAENETKSYLYTIYPTVKDLAAAVNADTVAHMKVLGTGNAPSSALFVNSAVSPLLGKMPFNLYAENVPLTIEDMRSALNGIQGAAVKQLGEGETSSFQIRAALSSEDESSGEIQTEITSALGKAFGKENVAVLKTDFIGSSFSKNLAQKSILLLALTFLLIWAYAAVRFHWDFALGSIVALIHDAMIMFTFIVWTQMEFSTTVLAAVLMIIGYSINDTVVILDRLRSNLKTVKVKTFTELLNISLRDTLSRSIITTATTLFAGIALFVFTTGSIKDFALALIVGLLSGLYSSIFISSGFIALFRLNWKQEFGIHHSEKNERGVLNYDAGVQV